MKSITETAESSWQRIDDSYQTQNSSAPKVDPMPVIIGCPRSGTTLLRFMLDSHPQLAIPPETGFFLHHKVPGGEDDLLREDFFCAIIASPKESPNWPDFEINEDLMWLSLTQINPFNLADGYRAFYRLYAARFNKPRWGDKTPLSDKL